MEEQRYLEEQQVTLDLGVRLGEEEKKRPFLHPPLRSDGSLNRPGREGRTRGYGFGTAGSRRSQPEKKKKKKKKTTASTINPFANSVQQRLRC